MSTRLASQSAERFTSVHAAFGAAPDVVEAGLRPVDDSGRLFLDARGRHVLVTVVEGLVDSAALVAAMDAAHRTPVEPGPPPRVLVVGASVAPDVEAACRWLEYWGGAVTVHALPVGGPGSGEPAATDEAEVADSRTPGDKTLLRLGDLYPWLRGEPSLDVIDVAGSAGVVASTRVCLLRALVEAPAVFHGVALTTQDPGAAAR